MLPTDKLSHGGRVAASLRFLSQRLLRGSTRFLAQAAVCFVLIYFLAMNSVPESWLGGDYQKLVPWPNRPHSAITKATEDVRIVVFGSQDVMGSALPDAKSSRKSWTSQLCKQLGCASYLSFVPPANNKPGLASNEIYRTTVEDFQASVGSVDILETPSADYDFLYNQYPTPSETADLAEQIQQFLSMPLQRPQPRSTIWIFTFGTWDVWNLAALPSDVANVALDSIIEHIFLQAEVLYAKALNQGSIAFSNFWANMTQEEIHTLTIPAVSRRIDERALENFRIVIPQLFDTTLTPQWKTRPVPPYPHTRTEQLRNVVALTQRWNEQMERYMTAWNERGRAKPDELDTEDILSVSHTPASDEERQHFEDALPEAMKQESKAPNLVFAPYPKRTGLRFSTSIEDVKKSIMEAQMRRSGVEDPAVGGIGDMRGMELFENVWEACFASGSEENLRVQCDEPDDHLFYDEATLHQRAIDRVAAETAKEITANLFPRSRRLAHGRQ